MLDKLNKYIKGKSLKELQAEWNSLESMQYEDGILAEDLVIEFKKRYQHVFRDIEKISIIKQKAPNFSELFLI